MIRIISFSMLFIVAGVLHAGVVTWDGDSGDKEWFNPINWDGDFVPVANDDVIIPSSFVVNLTEDTAIQSLSVSGLLTVENSAVLGVFVAGQNGVTINNGMLVVDGTINVALAGSNGIQIRNSADLIINGKVNITDVGFHGISLVSSAELRVSGTLDIINEASRGINVLQSSSVEILPNAFVTIEQVQEGIIVSNSIVNNQGDIVISQPVSAPFTSDGIMLFEDGILNNGILGNIVIRGEFDNGLTCLGSVLNSGELTIEQTTRLCLDVHGSFVNSGVVNVHSTLGRGVGANSNSILENQASGIMNVSGMPEFLSCVQVFNGMMINDGLISLSNFSGNGFIVFGSGEFMNSGEIFMSGAECQNLIINRTSFTNSADGAIAIEMDVASQVIENTGQFLNAGIIDYTGVFVDEFLINSGDGSLVDNSGRLIVGALGMIDGIKALDSSILINSGEIDIVINTFSGIGIEVSGDAVMTNAIDGDIIFDVMGASSGDPMFIEIGSVFYGFGLFDIRMN